MLTIVDTMSVIKGLMGVSRLECIAMLKEVLQIGQVKRRAG